MQTYTVLPAEQARTVAEKVSPLSWSKGRARTPELEGTVKQNEEILSHLLLKQIGKLIANSPEIQRDHLTLKIHSPKFSRYKEGSHYKLHTDAPWMGTTRTDLSCTLFLSDGYEGGELVVDGESIKGEPGQCVIYECGSPHEVKPVTSGERICAVTWLQSRVRCRHKRQLVSDMRSFLANFEDNQSLFVQGGRIHSALLRMWSEP